MGKKHASQYVNFGWLHIFVKMDIYCLIEVVKNLFLLLE